MKFSSFAEIASVNTSEATTAQAAFRKQLLLNHSNQIFHLGKRPIAHGFVAVGYGCRTGGDGLLERGPITEITETYQLRLYFPLTNLTKIKVITI